MSPVSVTIAPRRRVICSGLGACSPRSLRHFWRCSIRFHRAFCCSVASFSAFSVCFLSAQCGESRCLSSCRYAKSVWYAWSSTPSTDPESSSSRRLISLRISSFSLASLVLASRSRSFVNVSGVWIQRVISRWSAALSATSWTDCTHSGTYAAEGGRIRSASSAVTGVAMQRSKNNPVSVSAMRFSSCFAVSHSMTLLITSPMNPAIAPTPTMADAPIPASPSAPSSD